MKSFTERVKRDQEKQGLHVIKVAKNVHRQQEEPFDLITAKNGKFTFIRARGNGQGNINRMTVMRLQMIGRQCGAKVLHAKVNDEGEIVFFRIYER